MDESIYEGETVTRETSRDRRGSCDMRDTGHPLLAPTRGGPSHPTPFHLGTAASPQTPQENTSRHFSPQSSN